MAIWFVTQEEKPRQIIIINNKFNFSFFLLIIIRHSTRWNINTFSTSFPLPSSACNVDRNINSSGNKYFFLNHFAYEHFTKFVSGWKMVFWSFCLWLELWSEWEQVILIFTWIVLPFIELEVLWGIFFLLYVLCQGNFFY